LSFLFFLSSVFLLVLSFYCSFIKFLSFPSFSVGATVCSSAWPRCVMRVSAYSNYPSFGRRTYFTKAIQLNIYPTASLWEGVQMCADVCKKDHVMDLYYSQRMFLRLIHTGLCLLALCEV
jgi:hypothetical protein